MRKHIQEGETNSTSQTTIDAAFHAHLVPKFFPFEPYAETFQRAFCAYLCSDWYLELSALDKEEAVFSMLRLYLFLLDTKPHFNS